MRIKFSVLMSLYQRERAEFFDECLASLRNQTVKASEWVIVKDGPLTPELEEVIAKYKNFDDVKIKEISLSENKGLGIALSIGLEQCENELIARMDTDDIAVPERFDLQLNEFEKDPGLDMCGGQILEFETDATHPIAERRVPLTQEEIVKYHKLRNAFNHMTVMYKKSTVLKAGNYRDIPFMEDYVLWVDLLQNGASCINLDKYLCIARTNRDMVARRGGYQIYKNFKNARKLVYRTGFITFYQYLKMNFIQFSVCMMPKGLRRFVFFHLIHRKVKMEDMVGSRIEMGQK